MKAVRVAIFILCVTVAGVLINSYFLSNIIEGYKSSVDEIDTKSTDYAYEKFTSLYEDFKKKENYISLTVSHADLTEIEEMFSSAIGASKASNSDELEIIKSRLSDALRHLGRLVGINFDSIL